MDQTKRSYDAREYRVKSKQSLTALTVILIFLVSIFFAGIIVLHRQYRYCKQEIDQLVIIREEYQSYVLALKRLIAESQTNTQEEASQSVDEKKNH